jgi:general secretion pathway protein D
MKITPQINQEGVVRLKLFQEVIKLKSGAETGHPTTFKRSAETTVMIKDKNTIVIGGIIGEDSDNGTSKVPVLGDIPVLGWLFKGQKQVTNKTNLFIFITPYIIDNPADVERIFRERKSRMDKLTEAGNDEERKSCRRLTDLGYQAISVGDFEAAEQYIKSALALAPDDPFALINMGVIHEHRGEWREAAQRYERVISNGSVETAGVSTDPEMKEMSLSDIARRNLEKVETHLAPSPSLTPAPWSGGPGGQ